MALVRGQPQFNIETNDKRSIGYEAGSRRVAIASVDTIGAIQAELSSSVAASRSATLDDVGDLLVCNSSSAIVITIDSDATVGWSGAASIVVYRDGTGSVTFAAGSGVNIRGDLSTPAQYGFKGICRIPTKSNEWAVF